jgi:hypothetical protein
MGKTACTKKKKNLNRLKLTKYARNKFGGFHIKPNTSLAKASKQINSARKKKTRTHTTTAGESFVVLRVLCEIRRKNTHSQKTGYSGETHFKPPCTCSVFAVCVK